MDIFLNHINIYFPNINFTVECYISFMPSLQIPVKDTTRLLRNITQQSIPTTTTVYKNQNNIRGLAAQAVHIRFIQSLYYLENECH